MKRRTDSKSSKDAPVGRVCRDACGKVARARAAVVAGWSDAIKTQGHALHLALNEAEALAWQTMYPHLVFPMLATEKVQAVAAWHRRQHRLWWKPQL